MIWFNAMRALVSNKSRIGVKGHDVALDHLIRAGLVDWDEKEVSLAMQQWLCYPAVMANRLSKSHFKLRKSFDLFQKVNFEESEAFLKHLKTYDRAITDLVVGVEHCQKSGDNRKVEVKSLTKRVLELETRNVLLEAKVTRFSLSVLREETDHS